MTVDGAMIRDQLPPLVGAAAQLADQLHAGMGDEEYAAVAVAIVRALAREKGAIR